MITVLIVIIAVQTVFLMATFAVLAVRRALHRRRAAVRARESARINEALRFVLLGGMDGEQFRQVIDSCGFDTVTIVLQEHAAQIRGDSWEAVVGHVRESRWFREIRAGHTESRFWWRRLVGARALALLADETDLPVARELLTDEHPAIRLAAISIVRRLPRPELIEIVLDRAIRAQPVVMRYFFDTLAAVPDAVAPILRARLDHPDHREHLAALLRVAGVAPTPGLLEIVLAHTRDHELEIRVAAARALGSYPSAAAVDALIELLQDEAWQVRTQAASALGLTRAVAARQALDAALRDSNWWVRLRAAVALRQLGTQGVASLSEAQAGDDRFAAEMARYALRLTHAAVGEYAT